MHNGSGSSVCITSKILLSYFNFALHLEVNSATGKDTTPATDNNALEDVANSFQQLRRDTKGAMASGGGHPPPLHVDGGLPNKGGTLPKSRIRPAWHHQSPDPEAQLLPGPHKGASSSRVNSPRQQW
jgi:hypothetical protein